MASPKVALVLKENLQALDRAKSKICTSKINITIPLTISKKRLCGAISRALSFKSGIEGSSPA